MPTDEYEKITDEVYQYMLDDAQKEVLRARNRMETIVNHLKHHPTTARFGAERARDITERMRQITKDMDELPYIEAAS